MTNEVAIEWLKVEYEHARCDECIEDEYVNALEMAIKALEQQPTEADYISDPCDGCRYELNSTNGNPCYSCGKYKLTEQQPCEDCVSREQALLALTGMDLPTDRDKLIALFTERIQHLPPVTPTNADTREAYIKGYDYGVKDWFKSKTQPNYERPVFCIDRREAIKTIHNIKGYKALDGSDMIRRDALLDEFALLHSVTPERPKGKWIEYKVDIAPHPLHCSLCGFSNHQISNRYMREFRRCPNCGAEMVEPQESEG